jgi:ribosomal-protein-serine acetyltransferase
MHGSALTPFSGTFLPARCFHHLTQTVLRESSIYIRPFQTADGAPLFEATRESIAELCSWMVWCKPDYSPEDSANFIACSILDWQNRQSFSFAVLDGHDDTLLGSVGLTRIDWTHNVGNVGVWIRSTRTGRGIATSAIRLLATFAFKELGLARLEIMAARDNESSLSVARKLNARVEGVLRQKLLLAGKRHDAVLCSLIPSDLG